MAKKKQLNPKKQNEARRNYSHLDQFMKERGAALKRETEERAKAKREILIPGLMAAMLNIDHIDDERSQRAIALGIIPVIAAGWPSGIHVVNDDSPKILQEALTCMASYYQYEMLQNHMYQHYEGHPKGAVGLLAIANELVVGACLLRNRRVNIGECDCKSRQPSGWAMQWAWVHPMRRKRGCLTAMFKRAQQQVGEFWIEEPVSLAVKAYLDKYGYFHPQQTSALTCRPCPADHSDPGEK